MSTVQRNANAISLPPLEGTSIENPTQPPKVVGVLKPYNVSSFWWDWTWWDRTDEETEQPTPEIEPKTLPALEESPSDMIGLGLLIVVAFLLAKFL